MANDQQKAHFQFKLWQALLALAVLNALLGAVAVGGLFGFVVWAAICGVAITLFGWWYGKRGTLLSGAVLTFGTMATLIFGSIVAVGIGRTTRQCTIEVVDEGNIPVPGATVYLRDVREYMRSEDVPMNSMTRDRRVARGLTDGNGMAIIPFEFTFTHRTGLFINVAQLRIYPDLWIQVDACGFDRNFVRLEQRLGRSYDYFKQPLPKMKLRLKATNRSDLPQSDGTR